VTSPAAPLHDERLWFGPVGWLGLLIAAVSLAGALAPVNGRLGLAVGVVGLAAGAVVAALTTARVRVRDGQLLAGPARVPVELLAAPRTLDRAQLRFELGPALDARSFACLRAWIGTAVRVELRDPADPTPYWIVSTRHPERLVGALLAAGAAEH
jgi:hypothetical protein